MNTISCLWIQKNLDEISNLCIESWLKQGYKVDIYTYSLLLNFSICNPICRDSRVKVIDARTIYDGEDDFLPCSDKFRFMLLNSKEQLIWMDTDVFLIKRIPKGTYVSSEACKKVGAFSPKGRELTANIGVISQEERIIDWGSIIDKINKKSLKQNQNKNSYMKIYQDVIHKKHMDIVKPPDYFCPISWAFAKEIYTMKDIEGGKFGIINSWTKIKQNEKVYGIHLWRNIKTVKKYEALEGCVYNQIKDMLNERHYKICIPSYNRRDFLNSTTAKLLEGFDYTVFVSTVNDYLEYKQLYRNVVLVPHIYKGIGKVRSFIINEWAEHGDKIIMIDDDIKEIKDNENKKINLKSFFDEFFEKLKTHNLHFGGIVLCNNTFFMRRTWTTNLKYVSGALQFYRVDKNKEMIECLFNHFEDYFYNIKYFQRDGGILRCNYVTPITKNYNQDGGICSQMGGLDKRLEEAEKNADAICKEYPGMVSKYYKKKGRSPECCNLRLNHRFKM